jgi:tRNA:m4X modification enzyme
MKTEWNEDKVGIVGIAKHLCGGATDLTLHSLSQITESVTGLSIATCCHHACDAYTYVNLPYIAQYLP